MPFWVKAPSTRPLLPTLSFPTQAESQGATSPPTTKYYCGSAPITMPLTTTTTSFVVHSRSREQVPQRRSRPAEYSSPIMIAYCLARAIFLLWTILMSSRTRHVATPPCQRVRSRRNEFVLVCFPTYSLCDAISPHAQWGGMELQVLT